MRSTCLSPPGRGSRPTSALPSRTFDHRVSRPSSRSASASAGATRGSRRRAGTRSPAPSASTARPGPRNGEPGPIQRAAEFRAPILALMGGADQAITADDVAAFDSALAEAGVEHDVVTYAGAPHSFFDRKQEQFADVSADAWRRVLAFFESHTPA